MQIRVFFQYLITIMGSYFFFVMWKQLISLELFKKKHRKFTDFVLLGSFSSRANSYCFYDIRFDCHMFERASFFFEKYQKKFLVLPSRFKWCRYRSKFS